MQASVFIVASEELYDICICSSLKYSTSSYNYRSVYAERHGREIEQGMDPPLLEGHYG